MHQASIKPRFLSRFATYIQERFPGHIAFIYSILFALCILAFSTDTINFSQLLSASFITVVATFFLFFLRLRLIDEIKDYHYDTKYHIERPVTRGVLHLSEIKKLILLVLLFELVLQWGNSAAGLTLYIVFLLYSYLMYKEFFNKALLDKHFFSALLLHQFIFVLFTVYALTTIQQQLPTINNLLIVFIVFMFVPPFMFEIGRKLEHRKDHSGQPTDDTYIYRWGLKRSFFLIMFIGLLQGITLVALLGAQYYIGLIYIALLAFIGLWYLKDPDAVSRTAKYWSILMALLGMALLIVGKII